ncbi:DnaJ domain-containing protein [Desulfococcaceae bacterium HSG8]|nr:DnaJ domain-containing protein [Desulfococcaceae bacterium HSG8]
MENFYNILSIQENAGDEDIKKAFRMLAKQHHPDISKGDSEKFRQVSHAYKILSNPEARKDYDKTLDNFRRKTGDLGNYTKDTYTVEGRHLKKLIKEIINQGHLTGIKVSYKGKSLFSMSFPVAVAFTLIGLIKAPIVFLAAQIGLSAFFEIEVVNPVMVMFNEAIEFHRVGRITEAEHLYKKVLARSEYFVPAYLNLGMLYRQRGENKKAAQYFRKVLEIAPYGVIGDTARENLAEIRGF